ncbi:double-strand break repair protein AddB [uncultured Bartonella sp.]|uniref:double-strand break repair protein AddB n=1 Tax=uncultured Bartonella sp. TaxID=104108 RepID=UPI0025F9D079|nr:double-strand break repair protein AddB [uncultured Bartonella sp.]
MKVGPKLFSISAGASFLPTFVDALLSGRLIENFGRGGNIQKALADTLIYVPTRRAARALRSCFVEMSANQSSFLPTIRPLGDVDEDTAFFLDNGAAALSLNPKIGDLERLLLLARLIRPWRENLPAHVRSLFGSENIIIPANTADAIWLAEDLARLMDEVETESADWSKLQDIASDMVAEWWQVTLDFLEIVTKSWPAILAERQKENPAEWRNHAIRAEAERLLRNQPREPIIVAGSNGSIPAVADLLKVVSQLENGAVVLPGFDLAMDDAQWAALDEARDDPSIFGHPQYSFKKLFDRLKLQRSVVHEIGAPSKIKKKRSAILSEALRPAATTDTWSALSRNGFEDIFADISLIEAANEREEAVAIAVALRQAIEEKKKTAALVTGDRNLARRVVAELKRFGIEANDSGGVPLSEVLPATLLRLILQSLFQPGDPVAFLSLLKHPLTCLGLERENLRKIAERFELFALRGGTGRINIAACDQFVEARLMALTTDENQNKDIDTDMIEEARDLASLLVKAVQPMVKLMEKTEPVSVNEVARATTEVFENFGRNDQGSVDALYAGEAGKAIALLLRDLVADQSGLTFDISEWPAIVEALMAARSVSPSAGGHPRLFIWGALESRLQTVDTMVIGGLNEGSWPQTARNDPFMSRPMKMTLTLDPPERRTGLAAHDFQMAMGMDKVIMSRALRADNAPSVPSRWLQRLETVVGDKVSNDMRLRGRVFVHWARELDHRESIAFIAQPCPKPPLSKRPKHFSVTEIETLRRDPYAIYARKVLRLKPLEELIHDPSVAERGTLYHAIVAAFATLKIDPAKLNAREKFLEVAKAEFERMQLPLDVEAVWWPRFEILAPSIIEWESALAPRQRYVEISARPIDVAASGVTLSGRADRIDVSADHSAEILDFKTGSTPSVKQAATLMAPQLALEAALLTRNAFLPLKNIKPVELAYIRLTARGTVKEERICEAAKKTAFELSEEAWTRLGELIQYYQNPAHGYLSRAMPSLTTYEGDYDHLARVLEWSAGSGTVGDE